MKTPRTKTLAVLIPALLVSAGVSAQTPTTPPKIEKIQVTGSLIKRVDTETPAPVKVITAEQIKNSGYGTVEELLTSLSMTNTIDSIADGAASGFVGGVSTVSLRSLGSQATLILLNGRRIAPVAAVDVNFGRGNLFNLNTLPMEAIERIEILKDGASALYGSDAVAGVINYVLKKEYQGLEARATYGANDKGVGKNHTASISFGFGDLSKGRYNVYGGVEAYHRDNVMHSELKDRGSLADFNSYNVLNNTVEFFTANSSASGTANYYRLPTSLAGSTVINGITVANNNLSGANYLGTFAGCAPSDTVGQGTPQRPPGFTATTASLPIGMCRFRFDDADEAIAEQDRISASLRGTYAISNDFNLYADFLYSKSKTVEKRIPQALTTALVTSGNRVATTWPLGNGTFASQNALILPIGHPDNPTNGTATPQAVQLIYRFTDLPNNDTNEIANYRFSTGLQGVIGAWDIDTAFVYTKVENDRELQGRLRSSLLNAALVSGSYRFTQPNNAAAIASVTTPATNKGESSVTVFDVRGSRELFKMSGGFAAVAVGAEIRKEELTATPDDLYRSGDLIGLVANGAAGDRKSKAFFAELRLPVIKSLEVQAAVRHENFSDFGNSTTGKAGFKWDAVPGTFAVRGTAASGFRAPAIPQIQTSFVSSFHTGSRRAIDSLRCDVSNPDAPVSRANPANTRDCNVVGFSGVTPNPGSIATTIAGNPNLKPETSRSYTFGFIFQPSQNIDLAIDFWRFRRDDEIRVLSGQDTMDLYNSNPVLYANRVVRNPNPESWLPGVPNSGPIVGLVRGYDNFEWTDTSGMDWDFNFRLPVGPAIGKVSINVNGTRTYKYNRITLAGLPVDALVGVTTLDVPKYKSTSTVRWSKNNWSSWVRYNFTSGLRNSNTCENGSTAATAFLRDRDYCQFGRQNTFDIGGSWRGIKNLTVSASMLNIDNDYGQSLNVPVSFNYNYGNGSQPLLGRRFTLALDYKFK